MDDTSGWVSRAGAQPRDEMRLILRSSSDCTPSLIFAMIMESMCCWTTTEVGERGQGSVHGCCVHLALLACGTALHPISLGPCRHGWHGWLRQRSTDVVPAEGCADLIEAADYGLPVFAGEFVAGDERRQPCHCGDDAEKWAAYSGDPNYNLLNECCKP